MIFSRTDCVLSNLTSFISCGTSLTAILFFEKVNVKEGNEFKSIFESHI